MNEKVKACLEPIKALTSPPLLIEVVIVLSVFVLLYYFDLHNVISLRQSLLEKKWIEASYPLFSLLIPLSLGLIVLTGVPIGLRILYSDCISKSCSDNFENLIKFMLLRYCIVVSFIAIIPFIHLLLLDDTSLLMQTCQNGYGFFALIVAGGTMLLMVYIKVTTR